MASSGPDMNSSGENISAQRHRIRMQDIWLASVPIVLSVHIWSILHVFEEVPAWIIRMTLWELLGAIAYTQAFALLESVFILVVFLFVGFILPKRWFAHRFAPATSLVVIIITLWAIAAHNYDKVIRNWGARDFLPWLILMMISLTLALLLVSRSEKVKNMLTAFVERASVLSIIYLFIDSLSIIIVMVRNV